MDKVSRYREMLNRKIITIEMIGLLVKKGVITQEQYEIIVRECE